jgi:bifunctional non-homologous end joining protein LigD
MRTGAVWHRAVARAEEGRVSDTSRVPVSVDGRRLALTNLDKPLYADGTTKGDVITYYTQVAPVLLPHLAGRPVTLRRWPDGTAEPGFFYKNVARTAPDWVRQVELPVPGSTKQRSTIGFVVVDDLPSLVWVANLAGLELHVPQWRLDESDSPANPDRLVVDLDPGPPADVITCCRAALLVRDLLDGLGLSCTPSTSGNKGLQLYAPLDGSLTWHDTRRLAQQVAERLSTENPGLVLASMDTRARRGKVFIDWSQNHGGKTTISPYSLRGLAVPTVATPLSWTEVETARHADDLRFAPHDVLARVADRGDLLTG